MGSKTTSKTFKATTYLLFLAIIFTCAKSTRILDKVEPQPQVVDETAQSSAPTSTTNTLPSGQVPAINPSGHEDDSDDDADPSLPEGPATVAAPVASVAPIAGPGATSATTGPVTAAMVAQPGSHDPTLSFFMHDIMGGSHPSARVVTGIIANQEINGIPFSKTNNAVFPLQGATPLLNGNNINNLINPNNVPFLTGLTGSNSQTNAVLQNTGSNDNVLNGNNQPFVTAGQLPPGSLQRLMFGSITVIDDELTEAHELGSAVVGRAQGFYLASSFDGASQTIALTVLLHGGEHGHDHELEDAISFFGVHRTVSTESQIAVVGGTGKYANARGHATVETLLNQADQHITDGVDTILHFNVYLTE